MDRPEISLATALRSLLATRGLLSSTELQRATGKNQSTVSRALTGLAPEVQAIGRARATRYGLLRDIMGHSARQPVFVTDSEGFATQWGELVFLEGERLHLSGRDARLDTHRELPWFLEPLRLQGFLGRLRGSTMGFADGNPERWTLAQQLYVLLAFEHDGPGAFSLGEMRGEILPDAPLDLAARAAHYDQVARDVASTLPAGSSAGGEQPKFLVHLDAPGGHECLIVKFSPPRGTPFGERWHDLLHAEALALEVLRAHGVATAVTRIVESPQRTYLESVRFDRVGRSGKRHVVPLSAVHRGFVGGALHHWSATADALSAQGRLPVADARTVRLLRAFGRLIGNNDMHAGNLSFMLDEPAAIGAPRFRLAPAYDMLPMGFRPGEFRDDMGYTPLALPGVEPGAGAEPSAARDLAIAFWSQLAAHPRVSAALRDTAAQQAGALSKQ